MVARRIHPTHEMRQVVFESTNLWVSDFDGTMANTFEPAPSGVDVTEAYIRSIGELYGEAAQERYIAEGGHKNRTPAEIVSGMYPNLGPDELDIETERLVGTKLDILLGQIGDEMHDGARWPRPVDGFLEVWCDVQQARLYSHKRIDTAVISAGHQEFILRTFDLWDVPHPDIIVSEETVRSLRLSIPPEETAKPRPFPMQLVEMQWAARHAILKQLDPGDWQRILYTGDDEVKDGGLARNAHVDFVLIDSEAPAQSWRQAHDLLLRRLVGVQNVE